MSKISKYDVLLWVRTLYKNGYIQYAHPQLPDELQNESYQRAAKWCDFIRKCGTTRITKKNSYLANVYEIRSDIMSVSLYNCHRYHRERPYIIVVAFSLCVWYVCITFSFFI